jgi:uncharacterized damage-inducible protein DinB
MPEQSATLDTFYENWKKYLDKLKQTIAPLSAEQLALKSADDERSIGELAAHIISARAVWFVRMLQQYEGVEELSEWDEPDAPIRTADELVRGLDATWQMLADALARWNSEDMAKVYAEDWGPEWNHKITYFTGSWAIWHLIEHDLYHGGEISLTLGMHGLKAIDI